MVGCRSGVPGRPVVGDGLTGVEIGPTGPVVGCGFGVGRESGVVVGVRVGSLLGVGRR